MREKPLRDLDPVRLARIFAVNAIGLALAIKHFAPLLATDSLSVAAMLSTGREASA